MKKISVIIPVYNSQENLNELYARLTVSLKSLSGESYEIIMVEDCGDDNSWDVICSLTEKDKKVIGIKLARNYGQHNALLCGIRKAKYDVIVTLDDDLQNPPEEISKMLSKLSEGYDVVYGRPQKEQHGFFRNIASQITKLAMKNMMNVETARNISSFRCFNREICNAFESYSGTYINIDVLLTWGASKFVAIPVEHDQRKSGKSNYNLKKLLTHVINMLVGFSSVPLQVSSVIGFCFTFMGVLVLLYVLIRWMIQGSVVPGFAFLASIIVIFAGAQLFAVGIIGEYLARMHFRIMQKPCYVVRETTTLE